MAMRWYSVSVLSNYEKKVAESIRHQAEQEGLVEYIEQVLVPTEEVIEMRRGKKVQMERRFMPGYVLVRMEMTDRAYHLVNNTNRVTGFLGPQGKPTPLRGWRERERERWSIRGFCRYGRGCGRRERSPQSDRFDLWPRYACRA